jgi:CheY-like chemotaxis protein
MTLHGRGRVLIVDDEPNARHALVEILRDEGFDVASASDGDEAVPLITEFRPDVVVTDVQMRRLDGTRLARRVHALATPPPEVIMMSAYPPPPSAPRFLPKPLDFRRLLTELDEALAARSAARQAQDEASATGC